jgi:hypothetical protein
MADVVILTLSDPADCGDACGCGDAELSNADVLASSQPGRDDQHASSQKPRVPVLACADALRAGGATVQFVTACSDAEIDAAVKPVEAGDARLIVAAATDAELRAVVRRLVRHHAPPPSKRPSDLPPDRTVFDLPPLAVLALAPGVPDLVGLLDLPRDPATVAAAVLGGRERRLDLLRNDAGSVTLGGALIGGVDASGSVAPWRGRVEVDDAVLTEGDEPILACSVRNVGSSEVDGLPLVTAADATDGIIQVAVAVPVLTRRLLRGTSVRFEVRRARGRGASVTPRDAEVPNVDDGVAGTLTRKRSWWIERGAWAAYVM